MDFFLPSLPANSKHSRVNMVGYTQRNAGEKKISVLLLNAILSLDTYWNYNSVSAGAYVYNLHMLSLKIWFIIFIVEKYSTDFLSSYILFY